MSSFDLSTYTHEAGCESVMRLSSLYRDYLYSPEKVLACIVGGILPCEEVKVATKTIEVLTTDCSFSAEDLTRYMAFKFFKNGAIYVFDHVTFDPELRGDDGIVRRIAWTYKII